MFWQPRSNELIQNNESVHWLSVSTDRTSAFVHLHSKISLRNSKHKISSAEYVKEGVGGVLQYKSKKFTHTWNVQFQVLGMLLSGCPCGACGKFSNIDVLDTSALNVAFIIQSSIWAFFFFFFQFPKPYAISFHVLLKMKKIVQLFISSHTISRFSIKRLSLLRRLGIFRRVKLHRELDPALVQQWLWFACSDVTTYRLWSPKYNEAQTDSFT